MGYLRKSIAGLAAAAAMASLAGAAHAQKTIRAVMHSDLKILDPVWTTAYIVRNHGYMIYDTLFATDADGKIKPQMVDKYEVSATSSPTHSRSAMACLERRPGGHGGGRRRSVSEMGAKDSAGQKLMTFVAGFEVKDAKTFIIKLKELTGLVLLGLGKPSSNVAFMMPKRVADTDPSTQISDFTGSGPFVFKREEWKPGDKTVYVKFDNKARAEPAPFSRRQGRQSDASLARDLDLAGRHALLTGEIDYIETPKHDLLPLLKKDKGVKLWDYNPLGNQYTFRPNQLHKPFDNPKIRQALWYAFNQKDFLDAVIGDPDYYKLCKAMFVCGTPLASIKGMDGLLESNFKKAQDLLKEANYDGTPVVLMQSTDLDVLTNLAPVAKQLMEKAGFIDMHRWIGRAGRPSRRRTTNPAAERLPHDPGFRRIPTRSSPAF